MKTLLKLSLMAALVAIPMTSAMAQGHSHHGHSNHGHFRHGGGYGHGYGYGGGHGGRYGGGYGSSHWGNRPYYGGRVYHPTQIHWTPNRGLHTHGHYDYLPY